MAVPIADKYWHTRAEGRAAALKVKANQSLVTELDAIDAELFQAQSAGDDMTGLLIEQRLTEFELAGGNKIADLRGQFGDIFDYGAQRNKMANGCAVSIARNGMWISQVSAGNVVGVLAIPLEEVPTLMRAMTTAVVMSALTQIGISPAPKDCSCDKPVEGCSDCTEEPATADV